MTQIREGTAGRHRRTGLARDGASTRWWARVPRVVWLVTGLHVAVLLAFTFLYPPYNAPDEPMHVDRVLAAQHGNVIPDPGTMRLSQAVTDTYRQYSPADRPFIEPPVPRGERPPMNTLGEDVPGNYPTPNQLAQHPPGFYLLGAGFLDVVPGSGGIAWDQTVWLLRLLGVLLIAPLPLLCWAAIKRFVSPPVAVAASFTPLLIPAFERMGATVNNDSLLNLATSAMLLLLVRVAFGDLSRRTAIGVALTVIVALLTKGFALAWPPIVVLAYLIGWRRIRAPGRALLPPIAIALGGCILGGMWWLRNLVVFGVVQPNGYGAQAHEALGPAAPAGFHPSVIDYLHKDVTAIARTFWGALGLLEPPRLPVPVCYALTAALVVAVIVAFVTGRGHRALFAMLLLPAVFVTAIITVNSWHAYQFTGVTPGIQGRYLYPGLVGLAVLGFVGINRGLARWPRLIAALPLLACIGAFALELLALRYVLLGYWLPAFTPVRNDVGGVIDRITAVSPWPTAVTAVPFVAVAILAAATLVVTIRWAARKSEAAATEVTAA